MEIRAIDVGIRVIVNALAIGITAFVLPGIQVAHHDVPTLLILGIVIGLVNGFVKPVVKFLSFPISFLTMGLFHFVINAVMLLLIAGIVNSIVSNSLLIGTGGKISAFFWALIGGAVLGIVDGVLEFVAKQLAPQAERSHL